ncbi:hypothetical protein M433DRAFT_160764 [Acidomyces richmondensis BFW]|nr:hypothetical protein M433DRAFT_160764 [Acidomyces richmondensis BFW]
MPNKGNDYRKARSITHPSYNCIVPSPTSPSTRPQTLLYFRRDLGLELVQKDLGDLDLQDVNNIWTLDRTLYKLPILKSTILLGDFNIHYPV